MSNFKFFQKNDGFTLSTNNMITFRNPLRFEGNVEFCFQFDDEEPVAFGNGPNNLQFNISPTPDGNIIFNDNGRRFKIFAREVL